MFHVKIFRGVNDQFHTRWTGTLAFFLLLESSMRLYLSGAREFSCGPDWAWNWSLGVKAVNDSMTSIG